MAKNSKKNIDKPASLIEALRDLLIGREASTQEHICSALETQGYDINQSKVSRLLRKIGAIKVVNTKGQAVYSLPREPAPPSKNSTLQSLIIDIVCNNTLVIIFTSPGSASMVARVLDYAQVSTGILATIAGDDTIFVAPKPNQDIHKLCQEIKGLLKG